MDRQHLYVLSVDDDDDDLQMIQEAIVLVNPALVVVKLHNGVEALQFLKGAKAFDNLPFLILLDMNMPLMDGRTTLKRIKEDEELSKIPVVVFTTSSAVADQLFCAHYHVDMITKPASVLEINKVIEKLLEESGERMREEGRES